MSSYKATVDGLIEVLNKIKSTYGNIPIQVNAIGTDYVTRLSSVCVDDTDNEPIIYIETILDDDKPYSETFGAYTQSNTEI